MNMIKKTFEAVKADWFKDLPIIDLSGMDEETRVEVIKRAMRECLVKIPLKTILETDSDFGHMVESKYEFLNTSASVCCVYRPWTYFAHIQIFHEEIPINREEAFYKLVNFINARLYACHFKIAPAEDLVIVESGEFVSSCFNAQEFFILLHHALVALTTYYPLLEKLSKSEKSPMDILHEFEKKMDELMKQDLGLL